MWKEPLELKRLPQRALDVTQENQYWDSFELNTSKAHFGQIKFIHISPQPPHQIAVSCLDQVAVYDGINYDLEFREMHFKDGVNCCQFRSDAQLLIAGGSEPVVRVWSKKISLVRLLRGHTAAINYTAFLSNKIHAFSCSDDMTAKVWDLASQEAIATLKGHGDYVRAGGPHPTNPNLVATGGYDKIVHIWDLRVETGAAALQLRHREPVETLVWHPSGNFLASSAGNTVYVWDVVSGRAQQMDSSPPLATDDIFGERSATAGVQPTFSACNHQRAIPALAYNSSGSRLLSGGLDNFVKVYSTVTYAVVHSMAYPAPVQAVALSPDDRTLVVGMVDGKVAISRRPVRPKRPEKKDELFEAPGGHLFQPEERHRWRRVIQTAPSQEDLTIEMERRKRLEPYDRCLVKFRYHKALDTALQMHKAARGQEEESRLVVLTVLEELYRRNALRIALNGRTDAQLQPLLRFLSEVILDPRYCPIVAAVLEVVMEIYAGVINQSPVCESLLHLLLAKLKKQLRYLREMALVDGMLDCMMNANAIQAARTRQLLRPPVPAPAPETMPEATCIQGNASGTRLSAEPTHFDTRIGKE